MKWLNEMASFIPVLLPLTVCSLLDTNIIDPLVFQWFDVSFLSLGPDLRLRPLLRHTGMGFDFFFSYPTTSD